MAVTDKPPRTIFVVEDEAIVREMVALVLEDSGFRVLQASSFDEAELIWRAQKGAVDLLFTDIGLPGVSGLDLAREFKSEKPTLGIIISSGGHDAVTSELVDLVTEDNLLNKPYTPKKLLDAVRKHFDQIG
jgi:DNA-binding response OmpR family regulator